MCSEKNINKPLVSVIIPVYKVEEYIDRCIESVIMQTYQNIEIILVDDGSPDNCPSICDDYSQKDCRIRVIHKKNGGLSSARNAGISISKGEYLTFVDSDDWITLDMVEYMVNLMLTKNSEIVSVSYTLANTINHSFSDDDTNIVMDKDEALNYFFNVGMKSRISEYPIWIKMFKRELFDGIQFPEGTLYEDYTTNVLLIKKCKRYVKSNKICYFYYQGGSSIVRSPYKMQDYQLISQCEKVCQLVTNENNRIKLFAKQKLARSYMSLLTKIIIYGFDEKINKEEQKKIIKNYLSKLRKQFRILFFSNMQFSRKLLLMVLCINYRLLYCFRRRLK